MERETRRCAHCNVEHRPSRPDATYCSGRCEEAARIVAAQAGIPHAEIVRRASRAVEERHAELFRKLAE